MGLSLETGIVLFLYLETLYEEIQSRKTQEQGLEKEVSKMYPLHLLPLAWKFKGSETTFLL